MGMKLKLLEKRYNKLVNKAFGKRLTEQEYERAMEKIRSLEIQIFKTKLA